MVFILKSVSTKNSMDHHKLAIIRMLQNHLNKIPDGMYSGIEAGLKIFIISTKEFRNRWNCAVHKNYSIGRSKMVRLSRRTIELS